jgi:hypothetical protein
MKPEEITYLTYREAEKESQQTSHQKQCQQKESGIK